MGVRALFIVIALASVGCASSTFAQVQPQPYGQRPAPASPQPTRAQQEQQATAILDRAQAIFDKAKAAIQLDGTPQAAQVKNQIQSCRGIKDVCFPIEKTAESQSKTGALAGLAVYLAGPVGSWTFSRSRGMRLPLDLAPILQVGPDLDLAEHSVADAMTAAQAVADARAAAQQAKNAEMASIEAATTACTPTGTCSSKCSSGDAPSCVAHATKLWRAIPPKLADARAAMQKGCDDGLQTACASVAQIDGDIQNAAARVESAWNDVTDAGDDLATKYHQVTVAQQVATYRLERSLPMMKAVNAAIVAEKYCPSKKAFLAVSNVGDFAKRAAAHCKDQPPTGTGLSGAQIPLVTECKQVYAAPCP